MGLRLLFSSVRKLISAFCRVSWSRRQPLAHVGAVLSLLDGPVGCDPAFCVVWFRFRQMRRYLAFQPEEAPRVYRLLHAAAERSSGHGPAHLLLESAAEIGFSWCSLVPGWDRPGLPVLSMVAGPVQHFRSAILDAWRYKVSMDLCARKGFRGGPFLDVSGTLQLLNSDHVRERDKALLRGVLVGGVWNGFLLEKVRNCHVSCRFCGGDDHDGHLFWECTFPPLVEIRENPEIHELMEMDKSFWPRCLLWHGWLPLLSGANLGSPWARDLSQGAGNLLESALGSYSNALLLDWRLPVGFDAESAALQVAREPDVWTDGSLVEDRLSTVSSSGAGFSSGYSGRFWAERSWGHVDNDDQENRAVASCRGYCSVPGPLQSVQRAELWGVILALQASCGVHLGVDNLNVVRHVNRLLDGNLGAQPFEVVQDGDLLCLIHRMLQLRGLDTVKVTKVKGHADECMVLEGRVRDLDRLGNRAADEAADFGRRRVPVHVVDARRNLVGVCSRWYPVVRHPASSFFVAIARAVVNHDDGSGTAPNPLVWSAGSLPKRRRVIDAVRKFAFLPGPVGIWDGDWVSFGVSGITVDDVRVWPYSVSLLEKVSAFFGTLHWPAGANDLGVGGVSFVELLILYELWAENAVPWHRRVGRPISVSAVPFGPGIDI